MKNWKTLQPHPIAEEYRLLDASEQGRIEQGMRTVGYLKDFPIVIFEGKILDGRNRHPCAIRAGVEPTFRKFNGTESEARFHVQLLNEERRHLTPEEIAARRQARIERVAAAAANGESQRQIAEDEGISRSQVQRDISEAKNKIEVARGGPPDTTIQGLDGKKYKKKRKSSKKPLPPRDIPDREPGDDSEEEDELKDAEGDVVPKKCLPAFIALKNFQTLCRDIDEIIRRATDLIKGPGGRLMSADTVKQQLQAAKGNVWGNLPTHVCPYCHGEKEDCTCCKGEGWTSKLYYNAAPGNDKKAKR